MSSAELGGYYKQRHFHMMRARVFAFFLPCQVYFEIWTKCIASSELSCSTAPRRACFCCAWLLLVVTEYGPGCKWFHWKWCLLQSLADITDNGTFTWRGCVLSLFSCPVKFAMKYELNALRLLSSHVPPPTTCTILLFRDLAIRVVPFISVKGRWHCHRARLHRILR